MRIDSEVSMSRAVPLRGTQAPMPDAPAVPSRPERVPLLFREPFDLLVMALLAALGLALNHSSVIFGLNLSLADPVVVALVAVLAFRRQLWIPILPLAFFLLLSVQLLVVTVALVPSWTSLPLDTSGTVLDLAKLTASFLCLVLGVQTVRSGHARLALRAFVVGAAAVSAIAVITQFLPIPGTAALYYGDFRYIGLTNDPNNYAVITIAAIALLWYDDGVRPWLRAVASAVLISGALLSASKTGAIALALLIVWRWLCLRTSQGGKTGSGDRRALAALSALGIVVLVLLVAPATGFGGLLAEFTSNIPALDRISTLLVSFDTAVAGDGSERSATWTTAVALILFSPLLGVGLGTYSTVAFELTGNVALAHNTFLQIMAEWGLPLAIAFLFWAFRVTFLRPCGEEHRALWASSSTAFLVLLVGSAGLSLNNSRLFWFLLGITAATHLLSSRRSPSSTVESGEPMETEKRRIPTNGCAVSEPGAASSAESSHRLEPLTCPGPSR